MTLKEKLEEFRSLLYRRDGSISAEFLRSKDFLSSDLCQDIRNSTSFLPLDATMSHRVYCIQNEIISPPLCECGNLLLFKSYRHGYRKFCSPKCSGLSIETKTKKNKTKLEKYGDINYNNKEKTKQTNLERYGTVAPLQNKEIKEKIRQTNLKRYGVEWVSQIADGKEKAKETRIEKYGVPHMSQRKEHRDIVKETLRKRYGSENYNNMKQAIRTSLERYGVQHYGNPEKGKITNLEKYGVANFSQVQVNIESLKKLNDPLWLVDQHHIMKKTLSQISFELDVDSTTIGNYLRKHEIEIFQYNYSYPESRVAQLIEHDFATRVIANVRTIIPPREIDIWVPEYRLAIEFNGVYWHRPEVYGGYDEWLIYHQSKIDECEKKDIRLLHLWETYGDHELLIKQAINGYIDNNLEEVYKNLYEN